MASEAFHIAHGSLRSLHCHFKSIINIYATVTFLIISGPKIKKKLYRCCWFFRICDSSSFYGIWRFSCVVICSVLMLVSHFWCLISWLRFIRLICVHKSRIWGLVITIVLLTATTQVRSLEKACFRRWCFGVVVISTQHLWLIVLLICCLRTLEASLSIVILCVSYGALLGLLNWTNACMTHNVSENGLHKVFFIWRVCLLLGWESWGVVINTLNKGRLPIHLV